MKKYLFDIKGLNCSACSSKVEKGLSGLNGISAVNVNLLTSSMSVSFNEELITGSKIIDTVKKMGYDASLKTAAGKGAAINTGSISELEAVKKRLNTSIAFTIPISYISMGTMNGWPLPESLSGAVNALTLLLLTLPVVYVNRSYFTGGLKNLFKLSPNMDSLIAIGSGSAFLYGIYTVYSLWYRHGNIHPEHNGSINLYLESTAMILTLITLGKFLELLAKGRTSKAITGLINLVPQTATVIRGGKEYKISVEELVTGDTLIVKTGDSIPADGVLTDGYSSVDESAITGESVPVEKIKGDKVTGGTINLSGFFKMEVKATGSDTALAKIIRIVEEATSTKAPIAKLADKVSAVFVPTVLAIAIITAVTWTLLGYNWEFTMTAAISVLIISCPCALGLATPTAIMAGMGKAAANGILIKSAQALETLQSADVVVLDKTGTVTYGNPAVTDIIADTGDRDELLQYASAIEKMSGHPFADAIVKYAVKTNTTPKKITGYREIPGQGLTGIIDGETVWAGNIILMKEKGIATTAYETIEKSLSSEGKTVLYFSRNQKLLGVIALSDTVKPTSKEAVAGLTGMGLEVIMLTGDNKRTAEAIRGQAGISKSIAGVTPEEKLQQIKRLRLGGKKVIMVGDGINDAPALVEADVGIAIGAGTDIAIETADIVLIKSDLNDIADSIRLSKSVMRNIKQNLFLAFIYNVICIPVAAGAFYSFTGWMLNPMIAAGAMSLSSLSVIANALRLNLFQVKQLSHKNREFGLPA